VKWRVERRYPAVVNCNWTAVGSSAIADIEMRWVLRQQCGGSLTGVVEETDGSFLH
jgi:hypothetical protein